MGSIATYTITVLLALGVLFMSAMLLSDAVASGGQTGYQSFASMNATNQYASNLNNQSEEMQAKLKGVTSSGGVLEQINYALQSGILVVSSVLGLFPIGLAIVFDIGGVLGIPSFLVGLGAIGLTLVLVFQMVKGLRLGDI